MVPAVTRQTRLLRRAARSVVARFEPLDGRLLMAAIVADDEQSPVPAVHAPLAAGDYAEVGMNLSGVHYYAAYWPFADALKMETRGWMNGPTSNYGSVPNASLDARGNPTITGSFHAQPFQNSGNPIRAPRGLYTVTWTGNGTVGLSNAGTPVSQSLDGPVKTRTYRLTSGHPIVTMTNNGPVTDANGVVTAGVGDVHVWMPDPTDPQNKSLVPVEGREQLFHPDYLKQIKSLGDKIGYLRFMDWGNTNSSPQVNWSDRRPADHQFAAGNTNWKLLNIPGSNDTARFGNIGVPWEYMIELCNTLDISPWITVPHAATDDYIKNLAELMAGKSSTSPGLESGLKVYLEHSNEIWSNGNSFTQGDWAKQQADARGITKAQFTARRAVDVFRSFHQTFASIPGADGTSIDRSNDIIRVAAAFTGQTTTYTTPYLAEMKAYAGRLESAGEPNYMADTLAITTYFGGQSLTRYAFNETDWKNANLNDVNDPVMNKVFDHWLNEFTLNAAGGGIEGDAGLGGFGTAMTGLAKQYGLTLTSYEGGPSIYTETVEVFVKDGKIVTSSTPGATSTFSLSNYAASINGGKDTFTTMLAAMNRHPRMAEIYKATLSIAKAQGLKTHGAYNDISGWGKYGQWGTMEYLGQPVGYDYGQAVKWQFLQDWSAEQLQIRDIDDVLGTAPTLPSSRTLEGVFVNNQYTQDLIGTPGDGTGEQVKTEIIAGKLPPGLTFEQVGDGIARISGVPTTPGKFRVLVRSLDADKDPAYAIYTINTQKSSGLTTTYNANHDTFVEPSLTSTGNGGNGGSDQMLVGTGRRQGVVKFDMRSGVIGKVDQAILRIYVRGYEDSATNPKVPTDGSIWIEELSDQYRTSTAQWTEFGINNSTALAGTTRIGAIRPLANDPTGYLDFDVTEYVNRNLADAADRIVSFAIRGTVNNGDNAFVGVKVATKEFANNAYGPRILLKQSPTTSAIPPVVNIEPIRPNPRKGSIDAVSIQFSQEVTGLDVSDFAMTRDNSSLTLSGLTLSTTDNINYVLSGLTPFNRSAGNYTLTLNDETAGITNLAGTELGTGDTESWQTVSFVAGRNIFYNNSAFDGNSSAANAADDGAIATDKVALRPGQTAKFVNYTSYSRGINGIMIDVDGLPVSSLSASNFTFKIGNSSTPSTWATLTTNPTISVRKGAGINGSDRITLTWPDGVIQKQWLSVTLKNNITTGLEGADTFYFGNAVGETGNSTTNAQVDGSDVIGARANPSGFSFVGITSIFDFDRNKMVDATDVTLARANQSGFTPIQLIGV